MAPLNADTRRSSTRPSSQRVTINASTTPRRATTMTGVTTTTAGSTLSFTPVAPRGGDAKRRRLRDAAPRGAGASSNAPSKFRRNSSFAAAAQVAPRAASAQFSASKTRWSLRAARRTQTPLSAARARRTRERGARADTSPFETRRPRLGLRVSRRRRGVPRGSSAWVATRTGAARSVRAARGSSRGRIFDSKSRFETQRFKFGYGVATGSPRGASESARGSTRGRSERARTQAAARLRQGVRQAVRRAARGFPTGRGLRGRGDARGARAADGPRLRRRLDAGAGAKRVSRRLDSFRAPEGAGCAPDHLCDILANFRASTRAGRDVPRRETRRELAPRRRRAEVRRRVRGLV